MFDIKIHLVIHITGLHTEHVGKNTAWSCLPAHTSRVAGGFPQPSQAYVRRAHVVRAHTYNVYVYVVPVQGSPARSDLCFPKWVAACWADPDLGDTRAQHLKTQEKDTRQKTKETRKRQKTKT